MTIETLPPHTLHKPLAIAKRTTHRSGQPAVGSSHTVDPIGLLRTRKG